MASITVKVGSSVGLHARPASLISEKAAELDSDVTIAVTGGEPVDAGSALLIMTLGASCGDEVIVEGHNDDDVQTIADLVAQDLDAA
jgi:phosphocarrier protein HPr